MKRVNSVLTIGASLLLLLLLLLLVLVLGQSQVQAYTHPCVPTTREELHTIKANLNQEPWKTGYVVLAADSRSQLPPIEGASFPSDAPFRCIKTF